MAGIYVSTAFIGQARPSDSFRFFLSLFIAIFCLDFVDLGFLNFEAREECTMTGYEAGCACAVARLCMMPIILRLNILICSSFFFFFWDFPCLIN
jgi:hypothetical protein